MDAKKLKGELNKLYHWARDEKNKAEDIYDDAYIYYDGYCAAFRQVMDLIDLTSNPKSETLTNKGGV